MLKKTARLLLIGLMCSLALVQVSMAQNNQASAPAPATPNEVKKVSVQKPASGFKLFNLKMPSLKMPSLAANKKVEKYRLCAKRKGICKCQKASDEPGLLTVMDPVRCTPPPPPPVVQAPPLEDKKSIKEIQSLLKSAGYKPGRADGSMGSKTKAAIEAFQGSAGLQQDGIPSAPLLTALRTQIANTKEQKKQAKFAALAEAAAARRAKPIDAKTQKIISVQNKLNHLGYKAGEADGAIGSKTTTAIRAFQTANNMPANGKVSDKLLQRLSDLAPDDVSQPIYAGTSAPGSNGAAMTKEALPTAPAKASKNPLAGLFGNLGSTTSTKVGLPNSMNGYRNCALRGGKCLCQKLTDDPGDWTTMRKEVCTRRAPTSGDSANLNAPKPLAVSTPSPTGKPLSNVAGKIGKVEKAAGPAPQEKTAASSSFFDSIAKVLTPKK